MQGCEGRLVILTDSHFTLKRRNKMAKLKKNEARKQSRPDLSAMADKWPSSHVERQKIGEFSGGTIAPGTVANFDSKGAGPPGAIHVGRRVIYPVVEFVGWLEDRAEATIIRQV
jgi:hypothetical protein